MHNSSLSNLRHLIFTTSKLLFFCSHSSGQGFTSCWLSRTDLLLFGNLWPCHCFCINMHAALKWLVLLHLVHILPYAGHSGWGCPVLQNLIFYQQLPHIFSTSFHALLNSSLLELSHHQLAHSSVWSMCVTSISMLSNSCLEYST